MFEVTIEETFAAGHALRNYRGKCENVHGHNYRCQVTLEGEQLDSIGLLVDFVEMKRVVHCRAGPPGSSVAQRISRRSTCSIPRPKTWPSTFTTR